MVPVSAAAAADQAMPARAAQVVSVAVRLAAAAEVPVTAVTAALAGQAETDTW